MKSAVVDLAGESITRRERRAGAERGRSFAFGGSGDGGRYTRSCWWAERHQWWRRVVVDQPESDRWPLVGVVGEGSGRLANLEQMAIRIADLAPDLGCVLFRRR